MRSFVVKANQFFGFHGLCVSVNYKTSGIGKGRCGLNSNTLQDTSDDDGSLSNPKLKHLYINNILVPKSVSRPTFQFFL